MYQLCFYVPESHLESVKNATFAAGAGCIGDYDHCCWQTLGQGQFRPLAGSEPFLGAQDRLEAVAEVKVEMMCSSQCLENAVAAMLAAHPYEEPAWHVVSIVADDQTIAAMSRDVDQA